MAEHIRIRQAEGTWVVRGGGAVLAETTRAFELIQGDLPPEIYFPREDVATAFLEASPTRTHSPEMGDASHYSLQTKSVLVPDVAWTYEDPGEELRPIAGHLAFDREKVAVEKV